MKDIKVKIIPQLKDNYSFVITSEDHSLAIIIDPAEASSHINFLSKNNLLLHSIFITHHHNDHTAGIAGLIKLFPQTIVYSPSKSITGTNQIYKNNESISTPLNQFKVIKTPGHTLDHMVLYDKKNSVLFSGDLLFRLGCGRIFEGTFEQMHLSLKKINKFPDSTLVYCGHEYTLNNINFLKNIFKNFSFFDDLQTEIKNNIKDRNCTIPFLLGKEKEFNPFLNQSSKNFGDLKQKNNFSEFQLFKFLREKKDVF